MLLLLLLLLLCNGVDLAKERLTESLGGFTQFHVGSVMTHLMNFKKMCFSLSQTPFFVLTFSALSFSCPFMFPPCSHFNFHMKSEYLNICIMSLSLILHFFFFFLYYGRLRQVPWWLCAGRGGITCFYAPIWFAFNEAKYSVFVGGCRISCFYFPHPPECFQATVCARLKHILLSDWTLKHTPRQISKDTKIVQIKWDFLYCTLQKYSRWNDVTFINTWHISQWLVFITLQCSSECTRLNIGSAVRFQNIEPLQLQDILKLLGNSYQLGGKTQDYVISQGSRCNLELKVEVTLPKLIK